MRGPSFLTGPADCQWLRETALRDVPDVPPFASFALYGNEDAPDRLDLYASPDPLYTDGFVTFKADDDTGRYVRA